MKFSTHSPRWRAGWLALVALIPLADGCTGATERAPPGGAGGAAGGDATTGGAGPTMGGGTSGGTSDANDSGGDGGTGDGGAATAGGAGGSAGTGGRGEAGASMGGAGTGGAASPGTGGAPAGLVPMFVAIGKMSRTTLSCDDGRTWIANRSEDDGARCWEPGGPECDHHPGSGTALAYGDGVFIANFGWGTPGKRWRSTDGVTWDPIPGITEALGGLAFGNGVFVGGADRPPISRDGGLTWSRGADVRFGVNIRRMGFASEGGGRFVMLGDAQTANLMVSSDGGMTFTRPAGLPAACMRSPIGVASGAGVIVAAGGDGDICTSTDAGRSWSAIKLPTGIRSILWYQDRFLAYDRDRGYRSSNGRDWTRFDTEPRVLSLGPVAAAPHGTLVGVFEEWRQYYDRQVFYRSTDGVRWQALPRGSYTGSHPISFIVWGHGRPSAQCPGR